MDSIGNEELARIEEEDRKKGRILLGFLDDMPIYSRIGEEDRVRQKIDRISYYKYQINQIIKQLNQINEECGQKERYTQTFEIIKEN